MPRCLSNILDNWGHLSRWLGHDLDPPGGQLYHSYQMHLRLGFLCINSSGWSRPFKMYIKRSFGMPTTLKKGTRTLEECQRLCRRESTCTGIQHDGSCELLVDPHCDFSESCLKQQVATMDRPKSRGFSTRSLPRRRQSRGAAAARDLDRQLLPTPRQMWQCGQLVGRKLARVSWILTSPFSFAKLVGLVGPWISGWSTQCLKTVQSGAISRAICSRVRRMERRRLGHEGGSV